MKIISRLAIVMSAALLLHCSQAEDPSIGEVFDLAIGQSTHIRNTDMDIKFAAVQEDSRCPRCCVCNWEGNAEITLIVNQDTISVNTTLEPKQYSLDSYSVSLISVKPYPETVTPIVQKSIAFNSWSMQNDMFSQTSSCFGPAYGDLNDLRSP